MLERPAADKLFSELMLVRAMLGLATDAKQVHKYLQAAAAGTIEIFRNHKEIPVGYMLWAGMVRESALRFLAHQQQPVYVYEWDEGRICAVIEVQVVSWQWLETGQALRRFFQRQRAVIFLRRGSPSVYLRYSRKWMRKRIGAAHVA